MATKNFKRKLSAILSADVAGYSRLMGEDEAATVSTIETYRDVMSALIKQHRGRVVDSPGDNILAEFASVVDAVQCGVAVQNELQARNAELPENRSMQFRIGINLGDVIEEGDRIYGDGVNIAARLEALANPGGICISKTAFDHIETKLPLGYEYLGEKEVKNIAKPVGAFRVLMDAEAAGKVIGELKPKPKQLRWAAIGGIVALILVAGALAIWNFYLRPAFEPASIEKMAFPLPDKPSIAVLPFVNMSGDLKQDYIADGITANITTALSNIPEIFVIAQDSASTYKDKAVKLHRVAEDLGVRYVLEGSMQKSGDRIRITAQLIDALAGRQLWSEKYDKEIKDFFQIQDKITHKIVVALQVELIHGEQVRKWYGTMNFEAWGYITKGLGLFENYSRANNEKARELFEKALKIDPESAWAWVTLGYTHFMDARLAFTKTPSESIKKAVQLIKKALSIDDKNTDAYALLGSIYLIQRQHDKAIAEGQKSIEFGPNSALSYVLFSQTMYYAGNFDEGIALAEQALRLCPGCPVWYYVSLGRNYMLAGRYQDSLVIFNNLLEKAQGSEYELWRINHYLTITYAMMGQTEKAQIHLAETKKFNPKYSLEYVRKISPFKDPNQLEAVLHSLRKAGLTDETLLPLPDKPSIAVLPFDNLSGDPEQEYFSDGLTEEIISGLARVPFLFVIARNSSFTYKGKPVKVQQISKELGVRYVLEGSVRKEGNRVRITAQLIDAISGHHIWSERYDRELKNIFELQDEIMRNILAEMQVQLTAGVQAQLYTKKFQEKKIGFEVFEKHMQSLWHFYRMNPEGFSMARQLAEEAIEIDPNYAPPYTVLAFIHLADIRGGRSKSPRKSMALAEKFAQKALQLDDSHPMTHITLGQIHLYKRQHEEAIAEGKKALTLSPNGADVHSHLGYFLYYAGRYEEAIPLYEKAIRLNPYPPIFYYLRLGSVYANVGRYDEAIDLLKKTLKRLPNSTSAHSVLAMVYISQDRVEDAQAEVAEVLRINPSFTLRRLKAVSLHKNKDDLKRRIEALRKAGLPE